MSNVEETRLPGVGVRHDFVTDDGDRLGVISHRTGRRELLLYDEDDPDRCRATIRLNSDDSHVLAELLGGSTVTERIATFQQSLEGITIDWLPIEERDACSGQTIREADVGAQTGVSIVAVVRNGETIPSPTADFELHAGDTAVIVGTAEGIKRAFDILHGG